MTQQRSPARTIERRKKNKSEIKHGETCEISSICAHRDKYHVKGSGSPFRRRRPFDIETHGDYYPHSVWAAFFHPEATVSEILAAPLGNHERKPRFPILEKASETRPDFVDPRRNARIAAWNAISPISGTSDVTKLREKCNFSLIHRVRARRARSIIF